MAAYVIIVGIFLCIYAIVSYINLLVSARQSLTLANISWMCSWLVVVLNFAAGVLVSNHYSKTVQELSPYNISNLRILCVIEPSSSRTSTGCPWLTQSSLLCLASPRLWLSCISRTTIGRNSQLAPLPPSNGSPRW